MYSLGNTFISTSKVPEKSPISTPLVPKEGLLTDTYVIEDIKLPPGAMKMLRATASFYPNSITRIRMATISGMSVKSGTFTSYLSMLNKNNLLNMQDKSNFIATNKGIEEAGNIESVPTDPDGLLQMWKNILPGKASIMLEVLFNQYPNGITKETLAIESGLTSHKSGTFTSYLSAIRRNQLIKESNGLVFASDELCE